jgi:glyceraldehyde 3-phosphate dehydrogenase
MSLGIDPHSSGGARTAGWAIPELAGRLEGMTIQVPVKDRSISSVGAIVDCGVDVAQVNREFERAAAGSLSGVLRYGAAPWLSGDVIGDPCSCVFASDLTHAKGDLVKVFGWYDNEWSYACRLCDLAATIGVWF